MTDMRLKMTDFKEADSKVRRQLSTKNLLLHVTSSQLRLKFSIIGRFWTDIGHF